MLLSCLFLKNCTSDLNKLKENFRNYDYNYDYLSAYLLFIFAIIFFFLELIIFIYAIIITKNCSKNNHELLINSVLSITFTTPFVFFNILSNPCTKNIFNKKEI
jgi:hypothetical protein